VVPAFLLPECIAKFEYIVSHEIFWGGNDGVGQASCAKRQGSLEGVCSVLSAWSVSMFVYIKMTSQEKKDMLDGLKFEVNGLETF
jgi:hypothetical protein